MKKLLASLALFARETAKRALQALLDLYRREPLRVIGYAAGVIVAAAATVNYEVDAEKVIGFLVFVAAIVEGPRRKVTPYTPDPEPVGDGNDAEHAV